MKTQSIIKSALFTVGFSAFTLIGSAQAQVVNVDINDSSNPVSGTYSGQGALSDPGNNFWNALNVGNQTGNNYTVSGLTASNDSTVTGISFNLNSTGISSIMNAFDSGAVTSATAPALLNDFAYGYDEGNGIDMNFTIGGLTPGNKYNIFLYTAGGGYYSGSATFTIGATSLSASNAFANAGGFVAGN